MPDGRKPVPGGWKRIQIETADLESLVQRLRHVGARFRNDVVIGFGGKQIIIDDPSGNPIELFEPPRKYGTRSASSPFGRQNSLWRAAEGGRRAHRGLYSRMSLYEALALTALAAAGCFAYYLSRKDMRPKPPGQEAPEPVNQLMFGRAPRDRSSGVP